MAESMVPVKFRPVLDDVAAYIRAHPGCNRSELAAMITGSNASIGYAVARLLTDGAIVQRARRRLWPHDWRPE